MKERGKPAGIPKVIAINLVVVVVIGLIFEIGYRLANPDAYFYSRTYPGHQDGPPVNWARADKDLGWVFTGDNLASFKNPAYGQESWSPSVNPQGFRNKSDFDQLGPKDPGTKRIIVLGDSFSFGPYIEDSETLSGHLRDKLGDGHEVYDLSIPGWGVDQMYLAYRKFEERISPDIVILAYIDDDLLRVYEAFRKREKLSKPSFELADGKLVPRTSERREWLDWVAQASQFVNDYYAGSIRYKRCEKIGNAIFAELAADTGSKDRQLLVIRYPTKFEFVRKKKKRPYGFDKFLAKREIVHIDAFDDVKAVFGDNWPSFFLEKDGHPASTGNAFIADLLIRELR